MLKARIAIIPKPKRNIVTRDIFLVPKNHICDTSSNNGVKRIFKFGRGLFK